MSDTNYMDESELRDVRKVLQLIGEAELTIDVEAVLRDSNGDKLGTVKQNSPEGYVFYLDGDYAPA